MRREDHTATPSPWKATATYPAVAPAVLLAATPGVPWDNIPHVTSWIIIAVVVATVVGLAWGVKERGLGRRRSVLSLWMRLRLHLNPGPGFATKWDLWRHYGKPAARKPARRRPSLSRRDLYVGRWQDYAGYLGRAQGWVHRWRVYTSFELLRLVFAAPQVGKSRAAAGIILDAPGAAVVTTIRGDLIKDTAGLRQMRGRLWVWNPEGVGVYGSTLLWSPVPGCEDMVTAVRRAGNMVEAIDNKGLSDAQFWSDQASLVLSALLHAAALARGDMRDVQRWVLRREDEPLAILEQARAHDRGVADNAINQLRQFLDMSERTQSSVVTTINGVLRFMTHPGIVDMLTPTAGQPAFDFDAFINSTDTLYMVSGDSDSSPCAPLFVAFLGELAHHAHTLGTRRPDIGRVDPPMTWVLDEIANIAPIPVWAWSSWAAGSGLWMTIFAQSWAQLVRRWGQDQAAALWQSCRSKMVFGGTTEDALLEATSKLCGQVRLRGEDQVQVDRRGETRKQKTFETVDVLPYNQVRRLPPRRAVVINDTAKPTIVTTEDVGKRADYKEWRRRGEPIALPTPTTRAVPTPHAAYRDITPPAPTTAPTAPVAPVGDELAARRGTRRSPSDAPDLPISGHGGGDGRPWNPWNERTGSGQ